MVGSSAGQSHNPANMAAPSIVQNVTFKGGSRALDGTTGAASLIDGPPQDDWYDGLYGHYELSSGQAIFVENQDVIDRFGADWAQVQTDFGRQYVRTASYFTPAGAIAQAGIDTYDGNYLEAAMGLGGVAKLGAAVGSVRLAGRIEAAESVPISGPRLLATEGNVGTYRDLIRAGAPGDNITPNHIPSANRMAREGVSKGDGIAINMEQPVPGVGGRHRATFTYGTQADINMSARDALAAGVWDSRQIYRRDGLYTPEIRGGLQELIRMNKTHHPDIFRKPGQ